LFPTHGKHEAVPQKAAIQKRGRFSSTVITTLVIAILLGVVAPLLLSSDPLKDPSDRVSESPLMRESNDGRSEQRLERDTPNAPPQVQAEVSSDNAQYILPQNEAGTSSDETSSDDRKHARRYAALSAQFARNPRLLVPIDVAAEAQIWQPIATGRYEGGEIGLLPELESAVRESGLRQRIRDLSLPPNPSIEEVAAALIRMGQLPVLTQEFTDGTVITIGIHFGNTSSVRHMDYVYDTSVSRMVPEEVHSLLISHPQRMTATKGSESMSDSALEDLVCTENPEMYFRAMLLVDYVIAQETGHHIRISELVDSSRFSEPRWNEEAILRNACYKQNQ